jgi:hypothetical protein
MGCELSCSFFFDPVRLTSSARSRKRTDVIWILLPSHAGAMGAAAPDGMPPRRINTENQEEKLLQKTPCPSMPRRGPEAGKPHIFSSGSLLIGDIFSGSAINKVRLSDPN